ncbi:hypothetical protein IKD67_01805 [Candidatus Saccharibacteria bacterium]|nr:hypothetical protein [Candidatus Saccharibacteria bacterium]
MSTTLDTAAKVQAIYGGTWERWGAGRVPVGVDPNDTDFDEPNKTGGSKTVILTKNQLPKIQGEFEAVVYDSYASTGVFYNTTHSGGKTGRNGGAYTSPIWSFGMKFGNDEPHENMSPYRTLYMWLRTA